MNAEIQWEPPGRVPSWLLQHAQTANSDIPWQQPGSEGDRTRIDAALAELQERAAHSVDPELAHQHLAQGVTRDRVDGPTRAQARLAAETAQDRLLSLYSDAPDWARHDYDANVGAARADAEQAAWEAAQDRSDTNEAAL